jgi:hypothetical protein
VRKNVAWAAPAILFGSAMSVLACYMAFCTFSPVPFWDMWEGSLGFYLHWNEQGWQSWVSQHNEHRILLARLIFFLDYFLFNGANVFPIILNFVFVALSAFVFVAFLTATTVNPQRQPLLVYLACFSIIVGVLSSWVQSENLMWGFQSQFFLAQLLPLSALYALARSAADHELSWYLLAVFLGILSVGTMANGALALPFLALGSLLLPLRGWQRVMLLVLSVFCLAAYLWGYRSPQIHANPVESLLHAPMTVIAYVLVYMGAPSSGLTDQSLLLMGLVGSVVICMGAYCGIDVLLRKRREPFYLALLVFFAYIVSTAFITALGRINFGLEQAATSRYSTPALMGWVTVAILLWKNVSGAEGKTNPHLVGLLRIGLAGVCLSALGLQISWANQVRRADRSFDLSASGLAAIMGIQDTLQVSWPHPDSAVVFRLTEEARKAGTSFTAISPFKGVRESLGQVSSQDATDVVSLPPCRGAVDKVTGVLDLSGNSFLRLDGWVFDSGSGTVPQRLAVVDGAGLIIGYIFTGRWRQDVADEISTSASRSGFVGYMRVIEGGSGAADAFATGGTCVLKLGQPKAGSGT